VLWAAVGPVGAADMGLITGSEKGTYYQFGLDVQRLVKSAGINLTVHPSRGSIENIYAVYQPDFDDLAGRRVAIGREGSGTYLTARLLFKLAEITPAEMVMIDTGEALAELKAGRIDAMFYVAGYPVRLFREDVSAADNLVLPVSTVAVKAVRVSFDDRRRDCDNVGRFAQILVSRLDWLAKNGHPKWQSVDVDYPLKGWEQSDCVRRYLGKPAGPSGGPPAAARRASNPVFEAIKSILDEP
jgi:hypothetical protein